MLFAITGLGLFAVIVGALLLISAFINEREKLMGLLFTFLIAAPLLVLVIGLIVGFGALLDSIEL
jgi:hypothetical protein